MAVTLIIEDGSIVAGANSFVSVADYRAYAEARNVTLPVDDNDAAVQLLNAWDYLRTMDPKFAGYHASVEQTGVFPRIGVPVPGNPGWVFEDNEIPPQVILGQIELALTINSGLSLYPSASSTRSVKRRKVGPLETEFFEGAVATGIAVISPAAYTSLAALFDNAAGMFRTVRV